MSQEHKLANNPAIAHLVASFLDPAEKVLLHFHKGGHVWIRVLRLEWLTCDHRGSLEVGGVTLDGVIYRASINLADENGSGIIIDPGD